VGNFGCCLLRLRLIKRYQRLPIEQCVFGDIERTDDVSNSVNSDRCRNGEHQPDLCNAHNWRLGRHE